MWIYCNVDIQCNLFTCDVGDIGQFSIANCPHNNFALVGTDKKFNVANFNII